MATKVFIENGPVIDGNWVNVIATSVDGIKWHALQKSQIKNVSDVFVQKQGQFEKFKQGARIHINHNDRTSTNFDVQSVANQPTWIPIAQVETITLTGTGGTADVTILSTTRLATFSGSLTDTATAFAAANAADYDAIGIVLTSSGPDLIFTSKVTGVPIGTASIANVAPDLDGTQAATTANQTLETGLQNAITDINGWL